MDDEAEVATEYASSEKTEFASLDKGTQYLPLNWGLDRIDQRDLPLDNYYRFGNTTGRDVTVFVLDSGIRTSHSEFGGRARCSKNLVPSESCEDPRGHGTHTAASIGGANYGVAKGVKLEAVKVIGESGATSYSNLIAGVNHVIFRRLLRFYDPTPFVINMSVGGEKYQMLDLVTSIAANIGIVVVASSGNNAADACNFSPGSTFWAITVGMYLSFYCGVSCYISIRLCVFGYFFLNLNNLSSFFTFFQAVRTRTIKSPTFPTSVDA